MYHPSGHTVTTLCFRALCRILVTFCNKFREGKCQELGLCGPDRVRRRSIQKVCEDDRSHGMSRSVQEFCGVKLT